MPFLFSFFLGSNFNLLSLILLSLSSTKFLASLFFELLSFKADNLSIDYQNTNENINLNESYFKNEIEMINDFIEFKFFKKIMRQSKAK